MNRKSALLAVLALAMAPAFSRPVLAQGTPSRAASIRACDAGDMYECGRTGQLMLEGTDGPKDTEGAKRYYERACNGDVAISCYNLAMALNLSYFGGTANPAAALPFYARACQLGAAGACADEGLTAYSLGDHARARSASIKGCQGGNAKGCHSSGYMLEEGIGGAKNRAMAAAYYDAACKMSNQGSCQNLRLMRQAGGLPSALPAIQIVQTKPNEGHRPVVASAEPRNGQVDALIADTNRLLAISKAWSGMVDQASYHSEKANASDELARAVTATREKCIWLRDGISKRREALRYAQSSLDHANSNAMGAEYVDPSRRLVDSMLRALDAETRLQSQIC